MNENISKYLSFLKSYDGDDITLMEVCGSHTGAIAKSGIKDMISGKIHLVSGPGCPVCVTPSAYIDRLIELSKKPDTVVVTFGDMLRVPGSTSSLSLEKGNGAKVQMVYSPGDTVGLALKSPEKTFVFAAVGFETTIPVYAVLLDRIREKDIKNIKLLTALKLMPPAVESLCRDNARIDGFIAPGHVSVITGSSAFEEVAEKYRIPFGVTGFQPEELVTGIFGTVCLVLNERKRRKEGKPSFKDQLVKNFYTSVVTREGNRAAKEKVNYYFEPGDQVWRGIGKIKNSGLFLKEQFSKYDAGSRNLDEDHKINRKCMCEKVLTGKITPEMCPLFRKECTPLSPQGACMVSTEGSCFQYFLQ